MIPDNTQPGDDSEFRTVVFHVEQQGTTALHKRAAQRQPALLMVQGEHPGRVFRLKNGATAIGRDPACEIAVSERAASRRHAELRWDGDTTTITDLSSTNGTLLNSARIAAPAPLRAGNLIKIGSCVFRYLDSLLDVETLEAMHARGTTDQLTGAYNKAHLLKTLASAIELAKTGPPLCLIGMDLDHFKQVNDTHGHLAGDLVLKESARLIKALIRPEDILGRFGGEEFFVILPACNLATATAIAERIRTGVQAHGFEFSGVKIPVTVSLGVCASTPTIVSADAMFALADDLLYRSKREGRNRVTVASA